MKSQPLLSVIIPAYNAEAFIQTAYECILDQHIKDIEILFVDNNSTDDTKQCISEITAKDPRTTYYLATTQGAAAARNKGLEHAKGEYVYMLDVDDQVFPDTLSVLINYLEKHPAIDAIFGKMLKSHFGIKEAVKPEPDTDTITIHEKPYWGLKWFGDLRTVVGPPAFLYRRLVFETIGNYEIELRTGQDTALDIKLGMLCNIAHIDRCIYLYLKHNTSTTDKVKKVNPRVFMQWPRFTKSHLEFYRNHEAPHEFKRLLFRGIFISFGKMLHLTKGVKARQELLRKMQVDVGDMYIPPKILSMLKRIVFLNNALVYKLYIRHIESGFINVYIENLKDNR